MAETQPLIPEETLLWKGHPSQWVHAGFYFICLLIAAAAIAGIPFTGGISAAGLILPIAMWLIQWLVTRSTRFELTSQRFRITSGVLTRRLDELELFRVKDYVIEQPLLFRLVGLSNLRLVTSDATTPTVDIRAISGGFEMREQLRLAVQAERQRKRVREVDVDTDGSDLDPTDVGA